MKLISSFAGKWSAAIAASLSPFALTLMLFTTPALAAKCEGSSQQEFLGQMADLKVTSYEAKPAALKKIVQRINEMRLQQYVEPLEADTLIIGFFENNGTRGVGFVMFFKGCVVPGSVQTYPASDFPEFEESFGVKLNDDFKPFYPNGA